MANRVGALRLGKDLELLVEDPAALRERHAQGANSSRLQLTVGSTTSRPRDKRSSVPSSLASSNGWRSGAMIAPATNLSRSVACAIAESRTTLLGHAYDGGWLPGAA